MAARTMTPNVDNDQDRHWYWWGGSFLAVAAVFTTVRLTSHNQLWTGWMAGAFFSLAAIAGLCGSIGLRFPLGQRAAPPPVRRGIGVPRGRIPIHLSLVQHRRNFPEQYPAKVSGEEQAPIDASVAQERVERLRAWVGMTSAEVRDKEASVRRMRDAGRYWDPYRERFELARFAESGGLLATDPRTEPAFQAVDALRREMHRIALIAHNRWSEDLQFEILGPDDVVHQPDIHEADDLDSLDAAVRAALNELTAAMRRLNA